MARRLLLRTFHNRIQRSTGNFKVITQAGVAGVEQHTEGQGCQVQPTTWGGGGTQNLKCLPVHTAGADR